MDRGRKILANDCFQEVGSLHGLGASRITEKIDIGREAGGAVGQMTRIHFAVMLARQAGDRPAFGLEARPAMRDKLVLSLRSYR